MAYNAQQIMAEIQGSNMNNMRNLIIKAQNNPRSLSEQELALAMQYGQQLGIDMSPAMRRDKATALENIGAGVGGAIDSALFGIIPDNWYSSYRTKTAKNIGKLAGTAGSFFLPGFGILNATKGAKGIANTVKALMQSGSGLVASAKGVKSMADASKVGKMALDVGKSALMQSFSGMTKAQIAKELAKVLIRTNQGIGSASNALFPSSDTSQLNPYTQQMGIGGMPEMQ